VRIFGKCVKDIDISKCDLKPWIAFKWGSGDENCTIMKEGMVGFLH